MERRGAYPSTFRDFDRRATFFQNYGRMPEDPVPASVAVKRRGEWVLMPVTHSQFQRMGAQA